MIEIIEYQARTNQFESLYFQTVFFSYLDQSGVAILILVSTTLEFADREMLRDIYIGVLSCRNSYGDVILKYIAEWVTTVVTGGNEFTDQEASDMRGLWKLLHVKENLIHVGADLGNIYVNEMYVNKFRFDRIILTYIPYTCVVGWLRSHIFVCVAVLFNMSKSCVWNVFQEYKRASLISPSCAGG